MSDLDEYNAKRRFMRSPEPFGDTGESDPDALGFVVQRHFARRPHFDFRLELGGVLKSWAVPEGPSLDPADRRLAVATEDHPLSYADFQGVIPKDEYGAGAVFTWDRGTWVALADDPGAALEAGELKFRLKGDRLGGGWMLKKLPKGDKEWLLIKERDTFVEKGFKIPDFKEDTPPELPEIAGSPAPLPKRAKPQLPSPVESPPQGDGWLHEIKFDGYRTLIRKDGDAVKFLTRKGLDWTERYKALVPAIQALDCDTAFIDGEVAVQNARGATSLGMLQDALSENRGQDLLYYVFDLLHLDGSDLTKLPLIERKAILRRLVPSDDTSRLQFSDHATGDGRKLFAQVCRLGLEGVVSKRADAPYRQERTKTWLKAKRFDLATFQVIGFTTKSSSRNVASIILAEETDGQPVYSGRAGTGLSLVETRDLYDAFRAIEIDKPHIPVPPTPNAHFIEAGRYTAEIAHRGRTTSNIVRQAAILGVKAAGRQPGKRSARRFISDRDLASIRLTNPDREMFEGSGTTKLDIAVYYAQAGEWMLPALLDRPVSLIRCPSGKIEDCFYQRHAFSGLPDDVEAMGDSKDEEFLVIKSARGFLALPQFGVIEFHLWDCVVSDLDHPDRMTVDLDPGEGTEWATVVSASTTVRERLSDLGFESFVRTTGGAGAHVVVPLARKDDWQRVRAFLKAFAKGLASDLPRLFTDQMAKAKRRNRILLDINRTMKGSSAVASYSLRAGMNFPCAMPLTWQELHAATPPTEFHRRNTRVRLDKLAADPWAGFADARTPISAKARRGVGLKD